MRGTCRSRGDTTRVFWKLPPMHTVGPDWTYQGFYKLLQYGKQRMIEQYLHHSLSSPNSCDHVEAAGGVCVTAHTSLTHKYMYNSSGKSVWLIFKHKRKQQKKPTFCSVWGAPKRTHCGIQKDPWSPKMGVRSPGNTMWNIKRYSITSERSLIVDRIQVTQGLRVYTTTVNTSSVPTLGFERMIS